MKIMGWNHIELGSPVQMERRQVERRLDKMERRIEEAGACGTVASGKQHCCTCCTVTSTSCYFHLQNSGLEVGNIRANLWSIFANTSTILSKQDKSIDSESD